MIGWLRDAREEYGPFLFLIPLQAALIGLFIWASAQADADCKAKGGHIVTHSGSGTGVSSSGQVVVVTTTTSDCVMPR